MPHDIQVAVQGGGAKLSALLAAMEALAEQDNIRVKRMVGTSAGAIAACLFAGGVNPIEVKAYLSERRSVFGEAYQLPSPWSAFFKLAVGKPKALWSERPIREMLLHFLSKRGFVVFNDFHKREIDIEVVSADLEHSKVTIHNGDDKIIDSVLHSCGLPYLFRVPGEASTPPIDGGICENLPTDRLHIHQHEDGPVVAISFKQSEPKIPSGIIGFTLALLDTAITNSVERSKKLIPGTFVHEIETKITTFDFAKALDPAVGLGDDYKSVKEKAEQFLGNVVTHLNQRRWITPPHWETTDPSAVLVMENAFRAFKIAEAAEPIKQLRHSFSVTANSLFEESHPRRSTDRIRYASKFKVLKRPLSCMAAGIGAPPGTPYLGMSEWHIESEGKIIRRRDDIVAVPVRDPSKPKVRRFAFYFNPLPAGDQEYEFVFQDHGMNYMKNLLEHKKDAVGFTSQKDGATDIIELFLHVPRDYRSLAMRGGALGSRIPTEDLEQLFKDHGGLNTYGWRATQVPSAQRVFFDIE